MSTPKKFIKRKEKWTFLRKFRWTVYVVFIALMVFLAVCIIVGIATNIYDRYPDIDTPMDRPASLSDISLLQKRDCFLALETLHTELNNHIHYAYTSGQARDDLLAEWNLWSMAWRKKHETLGIVCRLTEFDYDQDPTMELLAEIYSRLDTVHLLQTRLTKRFATQYAQPLRELERLFEHTRTLIEEPGSALPTE